MKLENLTELTSVLKIGRISDECEFERAKVWSRKLRVLAKDDALLKEKLKKLRSIIAEYEQSNWGDDDKITDEQIFWNDLAERYAETERKFIKNRREKIRGKLKELGINQTILGDLLGHNKSYMSELMNGVSPFTQKDLIVIHKILKIELEELLPVIIPPDQISKMSKNIESLSNPGLKKRFDELKFDEEF